MRLGLSRKDFSVTVSRRTQSFDMPLGVYPICKAFFANASSGKAEAVPNSEACFSRSSTASGGQPRRKRIATRLDPPSWACCVDCWFQALRTVGPKSLNILMCNK